MVVHTSTLNVIIHKSITTKAIRTGVIPYSYKTTNTANNPLGLIYLFLPIYNK